MSAFTSDGTENRMVWDLRSPGFMEVWYSTLNHRESGCGIWIRYTITAPQEGPPFCELWGFVFDPNDKLTFAGKVRYDIDRLSGRNGRDDGALIRIADAWLSESHMEGAVDRDGRRLAWSLDFEPADRCFQHLPSALRDRIARRVSTVCSPNLSVPFTGTVTVDETTLSLDGDSGCQSHRWGRSHSETWTWAHCSEFDGAGAVFEGIGAKASLGRIPGPTSTLLFLRYGGEDIAFNELRWMLRARGRYELPEWSFSARTDRWKITGAARAVPDRMHQVTYTDPDGSRRYCANSEIADLGIEVFRRSGRTWKHEASLTASGSAHLEFGRREPFAELPIAL